MNLNTVKKKYFVCRLDSHLCESLAALKSCRVSRKLILTMWKRNRFDDGISRKVNNRSEASAIRYRGDKKSHFPNTCENYVTLFCFLQTVLSVKWNCLTNIVIRKTLSMELPESDCDDVSDCIHFTERFLIFLLTSANFLFMLDFTGWMWFIWLGRASRAGAH